MAEKVVVEAEELPKTIVRRIVKDKLSQMSSASKEGTDISVLREALQAFSESSRIFIHYLSATANDVCKENKRQTINAEDVFKALEEIEFPEFVEPLRAYLEGDGTGGERGEFRQKNAGRKSGTSKAKETKKSKKNEPAIENGVEEHKDADEAKEEDDNAPDS
ncbi:hypothetical protein LguiA_012497 [Lonicera macranthoides]